MKLFELEYGKSSVNFDLNPENIICEMKANPVVHKLEGLEEVKRALENPIGSKRLRELVSPGEKVCIIASDITRPCPSYVFLPALIDELAEGGVREEDIVIVLALGIHRPHTEEEMKTLTGAEVFDRVRVVDSDPDDCVYSGSTSRGTPLNITREVNSCDRIIATGNIEMHYFAGYSGGAKALMPGVSDRDAIQANHSMMVEETSVAGRIEGNNIRQDIEEAGDIIGVDFILNVVLDESKKIVGAVAGDHRKAHREGVKILDSMYKIHIPELADLVIASAGGFPKDINLYQAQKALDNAKHAVREGGIIILVAECLEGFGEEVFHDWLHEAKSGEDLIRRAKEDFMLGGHKAAAIAMTVEKCSEVLLVSALPDELAEKTLMKPFTNINDALIHAYKLLGKDARIIIMPHAGSTLPNHKA